MAVRPVLNIITANAASSRLKIFEVACIAPSPTSLRSRSAARTRAGICGRTSWRLDREYQDADERRREGQRQADAEILAERDRRAFLLRRLGDDQVRDRADDRQVAGEGRAHREREPDDAAV